MDKLQYISVVIYLVLAGLLPGCSQDSLTVPVEGKVTFSGNRPPAAGTIIFAPISVADGLPRRPGRAQFDEQGNFRASSFRDGDGLIPGEYGVTINCWKGVPESDDSREYDKLSYVPKDYQPPTLLVKTGEPVVDVNFDVPPKRD